MWMSYPLAVPIISAAPEEHTVMTFMLKTLI
jgi:hypothetical protein